MRTPMVALMLALALATGCSNGRAAEATRITATIIDDGSGPHLCTGVADTLPPRCDMGNAVTGWKWSRVRHHDEQGVRWGEYQVDVVDAPDGYALRKVVRTVD